MLTLLKGIYDYSSSSSSRSLCVHHICMYLYDWRTTLARLRIHTHTRIYYTYIYMHVIVCICMCILFINICRSRFTALVTGKITRHVTYVALISFSVASPRLQQCFLTNERAAWCTYMIKSYTVACVVYGDNNVNVYSLQCFSSNQYLTTVHYY